MNILNSRLDDYCLTEHLGSGAYGEVFKATHIATDSEVAIKLFDSDTFESYSAEVSAYKSIRTNQNLVRMLRHEDSYPYIVLELAEGGAMIDYVDKAKPCPSKIAKSLSRQLALGLEVIHESGYAHMDFKLANCFYDRDFNVKIGDFGLSVPSGTYSKYAGTSSCMAPEVIRKLEYDAQSADIFSLGVAIFIITMGCPPFKTATACDNYYRFLNSNNRFIYWKIFSRLPAELTLEFQDLMEKMLEADPLKRPKIIEVLEHPWFQAEMATSQEVGDFLNN